MEVMKSTIIVLGTLAGVALAFMGLALIASALS